MYRMNWLKVWICIGVMGVLASHGFITQAQVTDVRITSLSCSGAGVAYTLTMGGPANVTIYAYNADTDEFLGAASGSDTLGPNVGAVGFYETQENGTRVRVEIEYEGSVEGSATGTCGGGGGGGGGGSNADEIIQPPVPWEDAFDGRLNADPAEYYTIYCAFGEIRVYRSTPDTQLLKQIPISTAVNLPIGGSVDLGDFMSMVRNAENTITIYGSNGNLAPASGSKAFGLRECTGDVGIGFNSLNGETTPEATEELPPQALEVTAEPEATPTPTPFPTPTFDQLNQRYLDTQEDREEDFFRSLILTCFPWAAGLILNPFLLMPWLRRRFTER